MNTITEKEGGIEVKPFGIDVVVVEPGGIKTPWGIIAAESHVLTNLSV